MINKINEQVAPYTSLLQGRGLILIAVVLVSLLFFGSLIFINTQPDYQVLFSGLSAEDAGDISNRLKEKKIPFRLSQEGTSLLVPKEQVYELRLSLAADGLPRGGGVGFEVFDRNNIGVTDFVQRLNYQRALQGELGRTIKQIREIEKVRVHIATPRESLFIEESKAPTASVLVKTRSGMTLNPSQVEGIVRLVASAVEGLDPANVSVVDTAGKVLSKSPGSTPLGHLTNSQLEYQIKMEEGFRKKVQSMLEEVLGPGKAIARISAEIDFQQMVVTEEKFDPNAVVRSEQKNREKPAALTAPPANRADQGGSSPANPQETLPQVSPLNLMERQNEIRNYEISKINRQIKNHVGGLKKVSAAVIIDGTYKDVAGEGGAKEKKYFPRSQEDMKHLENVVKTAIGYTEQRGDQVEVINLPLYWSGAEEEIKPEQAASYKDYIPLAIKPAVSLILVILFLLFVVRPILKRRPANTALDLRPIGAPAGPELIPAEISYQRTKELALSPKEYALQIAQQDPAKAVAVVRSWIN